MNRKFVLTLILAVVMISVIAFSACGVALAEEGVIWDRFDAENKKASSPHIPGSTRIRQLPASENMSPPMESKSTTDIRLSP